MYHETNKNFIMEQLERAGAGLNTQEAGAIWITAALRGIGRSSLTAANADKRKKLHQKLKDALGVIDSMDELDRAWFSEVREVIAAQELLMGLVVAGNRGGDRDKAHHKLIYAVRSFFVSEGLKITLSESSPFVRIISHCIRPDPTGDLVGNPDVAKRTISRLCKSADLQEASEERASREATERAYAASVCRLTGGD